MSNVLLRRTLIVFAAIMLFGGWMAFGQEVVPPPFSSGDLDFENLPLVEGISLGAALSFLISLIKRYTPLTGNVTVGLLALLVSAYVFVMAFFGSSDPDLVGRLMLSIKSVGYFVIGNQAFYLWLGHKVEGKANP